MRVWGSGVRGSGFQGFRSAPQQVEGLRSHMQIPNKRHSQPRVVGRWWQGAVKYPPGAGGLVLGVGFRVSWFRLDLQNGHSRGFGVYPRSWTRAPQPASRGGALVVGGVSSWVSWLRVSGVRGGPQDLDDGVDDERDQPLDHVQVCLGARPGLYENWSL